MDLSPGWRHHHAGFGELLLILVIVHGAFSCQLRHRPMQLPRLASLAIPQA
jgi:hypothetical protein